MAAVFSVKWARTRVDSRAIPMRLWPRLVVLHVRHSLLLKTDAINDLVDLRTFKAKQAKQLLTGLVSPTCWRTILLGLSPVSLLASVGCVGWAGFTI